MLFKVFRNNLNNLKDVTRSLRNRIIQYKWIYCTFILNSSLKWKLKHTSSIYIQNFIKEYDTFLKTIWGLNRICTLKVGVWCLDKIILICTKIPLMVHLFFSFLGNNANDTYLIQRSYTNIYVQPWKEMCDTKSHLHNCFQVNK